MVRCEGFGDETARQRNKHRQFPNLAWKAKTGATNWKKLLVLKYWIPAWQLPFAHLYHDRLQPSTPHLHSSKEPRFAFTGCFSIGLLRFNSTVIKGERRVFAVVWRWTWLENKFSSLLPGVSPHLSSSLRLIVLASLCHIRHLPTRLCLVDPQLLWQCYDEIHDQ